MEQTVASNVLESGVNMEEACWFAIERNLNASQFSHMMTRLHEEINRYEAQQYFYFVNLAETGQYAVVLSPTLISQAEAEMYFKKEWATYNEVELGGESEPKVDVIELVKDTVKVAWVRCGEGYYGDYDPESFPGDVELLRADISVLEDGEWQLVRNGSFCTNFPVSASLVQQRQALEYMMHRIYDPLVTEKPVQVILSELSFMDLETLNTVHTVGLLGGNKFFVPEKIAGIDLIVELVGDYGKGIVTNQSMGIEVTVATNGIMTGQGGRKHKESIAKAIEAAQLARKAS